MPRWKNFLHPEVWGGLAILLALSLPFLFSNADLTLAGLFYHDGWSLGDRQPWAALYTYGTWPGLALSAVALVVFFGSWIWPRWQPKRRAAALVVLTLLIAPGLLINALGKDFWGRPRPRDVQAFQGNQAFHRFVHPAGPGQGESFPCGHASVGFLFASLYFVSRRRTLRWGALGLGLGYGSLMGLARMAQGAHFASDVLWSGGVTYLTAAVLHHVVLPPAPDPSAPAPASPPAAPGQKLLGWTLLAVSLSLLTAFFLLASPFHKTWSGSVEGSPDLTAVHIVLPGGTEEIRLDHAEQGPAVTAKIEMRGFGFPKLDLVGGFMESVQGTTLTATLNVRFNRITTERTGRIDIRVRSSLAAGLETKGDSPDIRLGAHSSPGYWEDLRIATSRGNIGFWIHPGARVSGPVWLQSQKGDIKVQLEDLLDPGRPEWELGSEQGSVLVTAVQKQATLLPLKLRAWTRTGAAVFDGTISPACGLDLRWDEGDGRSSLSAKGIWHQEGNQFIGPAGMGLPHFRIYLAASTGLLGVKLNQGEGEAVEAWPTPTVTPTPWRGDHAGMMEIELEPTPTPQPARWIERELMDLPTGNQQNP
ncbi:MAG: phosphatase PAP2 family protein [candidate division FCPU426 bacterium]